MARCQAVEHNVLGSMTGAMIMKIVFWLWGLAGLLATGLMVMFAFTDPSFAIRFAPALILVELGWIGGLLFFGIGVLFGIL